MFVASLCCAGNLHAQIAEAFADADLTTGPTWKGTMDNFMVNSSGQLQLNATTAGKSWLSTELSFAGDEILEWEFFIRQSFAPSGANFGRFYLMSDQEDLTAPLNGYYLQFGESGSEDAVQLFRQSGTTSVSLCRATTGAIATAFAIRVKITRTGPGLWELLVDYTAGTDYIVEASAADTVHTTSKFCGIVCTYTITNATRFFFDDIAVRRTAAPDTHAPEVVSLEVLSSTMLLLNFSEAIDSVSAMDLSNYALSSGEHPTSSVARNDVRTIELSFDQPFKNGYEQNLRITGLKDHAGNVMNERIMTFLYFLPAPVHFKDVVFTEIMADPSPPVGLPDGEFLEIFNRSEHAVDLNGWILSDGSTEAALGKIILLPGQYLILTSPGNTGALASFGNVVSSSPFPSLNNAGDHLFLKSAEAVVIDSVAYERAWYRDDEKSDGGWSLELIDPQNICALEVNWIAAADINGGTPGSANSVYAAMPDNMGPRLLAVQPLNENVLQLIFDERLAGTIPSVSNIRIEPTLGIDAISFPNVSLDVLEVTLSDPMQRSTAYTITLAGIFDCPGNEIRQAFASSSFILPERASPGDIIVNEVLFNPRPTGVDFVEVYNRSEKIIDLKHWSLRNADAGPGNASRVLTAGTLLIYPKQFRVFTEDPDVLKGEYVQGKEETFAKADLPALNDDEGAAVIVDDQGIVIDSMYYSDAMHVAFVRDDEGVSLERISFDEPDEEAVNWRSASATAGFATPGYVNSNARESLFVDEGSVVVEPEIIQPQRVAQDFTRIRYRFDRAGLIASVRIFDPQGRTVKEIADNQLIGPEGFFRWDGDRDNGSLARKGYYMVWFRVFDSHGQLKTFRKPVVVY